MPTVEQLERRLQKAQDALDGALQAGNPVAVTIYMQQVRNDDRALREARLKNGDY